MIGSDWQWNAVFGALPPSLPASPRFGLPHGGQGCWLKVEGFGGVRVHSSRFTVHSLGFKVWRLGARRGRGKVGLLCGIWRLVAVDGGGAGAFAPLPALYDKAG